MLWNLYEQLTERLRDPRGLRKRIPLGAGARGAGLGAGSQRVAGRGGAQRGAVRRVRFCFFLMPRATPCLECGASMAFQLT